MNKFIHDHAGRLISKRTAAGAQLEAFSYDVQDQLRQVQRSGLVTEKLEYDPSGAPLFRKVGNQAIYYVGPFATVTATANAGCTGYGCPVGTGTGSIGYVQVSAHVILAGSRMASVRASNVLYYHRDRQGTVVATTTTNGAVGVKYRYTPYGQLDRVEGVDTANGSELGYTGGLRLGWNPSTGARQGDLVLLGARVYDAALKRWLQADTVDAQRYTYAGGDPVNMVDPTGRLPASDGYSFYAFQPFDGWTGPLSASSAFGWEDLAEAEPGFLALRQNPRTNLAVEYLFAEMAASPIEQTKSLMSFAPGARGYWVQQGEFCADASDCTFIPAGPPVWRPWDEPMAMRLPPDPSGLGPEWKRDPRHRHPNGERYRDPSGRPLDFHPAQPGKPGWGGRDHWHVDDGKEHLPPGTEIPDPDLDDSGPATRVLVGGVAALGAGYAAYRVARMLPSLLPPLWPTIPANAVLP